MHKRKYPYLPIAPHWPLSAHLWFIQLCQPYYLFTREKRAEVTEGIKRIVLLTQDANAFNEVTYIQDQSKTLIKPMSSLYGMVLINGPIGTWGLEILPFWHLLWPSFLLSINRGDNCPKGTSSFIKSLSQLLNFFNPIEIPGSLIMTDHTHSETVVVKIILCVKPAKFILSFILYSDSLWRFW